MYKFAARHGDSGLLQLHKLWLNGNAHVNQLIQETVRGTSFFGNGDQKQALERYWKGQSSKPRHLEIAMWLLQQLRKPPNKMDFMQFYSHWPMNVCKSILPLQLASLGVRPRLPWTPEMVSLAAAHGDLHTLKYILLRPAGLRGHIVHRTCPMDRMLLLVHGHGWGNHDWYGWDVFKGHGRDVNDERRQNLRNATRCYLAFWSIPRRLRQVPNASASHLGSLPEELLKRIACLAGVDFSWTLSDLDNILPPQSPDMCGVLDSRA